jgi:2-dehydro-3-deoxyphosphogluconate aldolase/(4S)-4-hydroxy-2-oxoglutarate aldolase
VTPGIPAVVARLREEGVVAVIRGDSLEQARSTTRAAIAAGARAVEITYTVPDAATLIAELAGGDCLVGAGTLTREWQLREAVDAGAVFAVSPVDPAWLVAAAHARGVLAVPGCATPQEVWTATERGARLVKIFPSGRLGGPSYLRDLRGPFPDVALMASGGVRPEQLDDYRAAGAACIGVNGQAFLPVEHAAAAAVPHDSTRHDERTTS